AERCPALADSPGAEVPAREALAARVSRAKDRKLELTGLGIPERFLLEPVGAVFPLGDLDPATLEATFGPARAVPMLDRSVRVRDSDGNGVPELPVTFEASSLRALFDAAPPGTSRVTMGLAGALRSGARVRGEVV